MAHRKAHGSGNPAQDRVNTALKKLCEGGIIYAKRLQDHFGEIADLTEERFKAFLKATNTKVCTMCADWLRRVKSWTIDVTFLAPAGPNSPTKSQNNIGGTSITGKVFDL